MSLKKGLITPLISLQLTDYPTSVQARSMSLFTMDELLESQGVLSLELNELKSQFGHTSDLMNELLSYHRPVVVPEVIAPANVPDFIPYQGLPHGRHPHPGSSMAPHQQSPLIPRPRQSNPVYNQYPNQQGNYARQGQREAKKVARNMDHVPMSYTRLLPLLLMHSLVKIREAKAPPTPLPLDYDANAKCVFHSGAPGHSTEDCQSLKYKVQDLIDSRVIMFTPQGLNVVRTPKTSQASASAVPNPHPN